MRRRAAVLLVFVVLGFLTSLLTAWGFVVLTGLTVTNNQLSGGTIQAGTSTAAFLVYGNAGIEVFYTFTGATASTFGVTTMTTVPSWADQSMPLGEPNEDSIQMAAGWPLLFVGCENGPHNRTTVSVTDFEEGWRHAILVPVSSSPIRQPLPLRLIWPNWLASTAVYALGLWLAWLAAGAGWLAFRKLAVPPAPTSANPICPRCAYDQRGVIAQWRESCPLHGICSECGLEFEWNELLNPSIHLPLWCVERPCGWWRVPLQWIGTVLRAHRAWVFYRAIRMSHDLQPRRLAVFVLGIVAVAWVTFALAHGWIVWSDWHRNVSNGGTASTGGCMVFLQAVVFPLSMESIGTYSNVRGGLTGPYPYLAPGDAFDRTWEFVWPPLMWLIPAHFCCGLAFAALPVSRRRFKVRWRHIARLSIYGLALLLPPVLLTIISVAMRESAPLLSGLVWLFTLASWCLLPLLLLAWWSFGTSRYLRMPHGWAVGAVVMVIGVMLPLVPWAIYVWIASPF